MYPTELNVPRLDSPTAPAAEKDFMQDEIVIRSYFKTLRKTIMKQAI